MIVTALMFEIVGLAQRGPLQGGLVELRHADRQGEERPEAQAEVGDVRRRRRVRPASHDEHRCRPEAKHCDPADLGQTSAIEQKQANERARHLLEQGEVNGSSVAVRQRKNCA